MKPLVLTVILLVSGLANAFSQQLISPEAQAAVANRNFAPAILELDALLAKDANNELALTYRANFLSSSGQFEKALVDAGNALKINPQNINVLIIAGGAKVSLKQYPDAIRYYSSAISLKPDLAVSWMMRAKTYVFTEEFEKAIKDFDEVIKLEPKSIEAHLLRGRMYIRNEEPQFALQDYIFVRENTPAGSPVFEAATKEFALAEKLYEKASQEKQAAVRAQMAADLDKEEESSAQSQFDNFGEELAVLKAQQEQVTKVIQAASVEIHNLNNAPKGDYYKQADAREAARPKLLEIARVLEQAVKATADLRSDFSLESRKQWINLQISNSSLLESCDPYTIKSNRVMGAIKETTEKTNALMNKATTARDNKDQAGFDKSRTEAIASLKASITIAHQAILDLEPFNKPSFPEFKNNVNSYIERNTKDLQYFELLKMP